MGWFPHFDMFCLFFWVLISLIVFITGACAVSSNYKTIKKTGYADKNNRTDLRLSLLITLFCWAWPLVAAGGIVYGIWRVLASIGEIFRLAFGRSKEEAYE